MKHRKTPDQWLALWILLLVLAFGGASFLMGCDSFVRMTEAHRQVADQEVKALQKVKADMTGWTVPAEIIILTMQAMDDALALSIQMSTIVGPPANPQPYTHETVTKVLAESKADLAESKVWAWTKAIGSILIQLALGAGGFDLLSRKFPAIASAGRTLKSFITKADAEMPEDVTKRIVESHPIAKKLWDAIPESPTPSNPNPS